MSYVYFARSLRGDKGTPEILHTTVVNAIREAGYRPQFDIPVYLDRTILSPDQYIYMRDIAWLERCWGIIAEVSHASLGVGYEIAYMHLKIQTENILCVAEKEASVSAMIAGRFEVQRYRDLSDLTHIIAEWLPVPVQS
jgi:hypothetical protein